MKAANFLVDNSVAQSNNLVVGANEPDFHYRNFNFTRDVDASRITVADIATVISVMAGQ